MKAFTAILEWGWDRKFRGPDFECINEPFIRLMADYSSSGLWDLDGCMTDYNTDIGLHISYSLRVDYDAWVNEYYLNEIWKPPNERKKQFSLDSHNKIGYALAKRFKNELPHYDVVYFDEISRKNVIIV